MAKGRHALGEQELAIWRWIAEHAPVTAAEVAEQFAAERDLARTTVLTVIERLLRKGYLARTRPDGIYQYTPRVAPGEVSRGLVREFVEKMLAGSVSPLVAYLAERQGFSEAELADLQRLVEEVKTRRSGGDAEDQP